MTILEFNNNNNTILSTYYCNHKSRKVRTLKRKFGQLIFTDFALNSEHSQTWLTCLDQDRKLMLMIFAFCHLSAMTSVMTNPVMYGFLNENFKTSLVYILSNFCCFKRIFPTNLQVRSNKYCIVLFTFSHLKFTSSIYQKQHSREESIL